MGSTSESIDAMSEIAETYIRVRADMRELPREISEGAKRAATEAEQKAPIKPKVDTSGVPASGQRAGKEFSEGFYRDASGRLRAANGRFATEAERKAFEGGGSSGKKFGQEFSKNAEGGFAHLRDRIVRIAEYAGIILATKAVFDFGRESIEAAREQDRAARITEARIRSTGAAAHVTSDDIQHYADRQSLLIGVQDDVIRSGANMLLTFTSVRNEVGKGNDIFNQASKVTLDMAASFGQGKVSAEGLQSASVQVGKALQDPILGLSALRRVGVNFTDQQKAQIEQLVKSGRTLQAQKLILHELNTEFGGTAAKSADAGDRFAVFMDSIKERVGRVLIPIQESVFNFFARVLPNAVSQGMKLFHQLVGVIGPTVTAIIGGFSTAIGDLKTTFMPLAPVVLAAGAAFGGALLVALRGIAGVLPPITGFLRDHAGVVRAVAAGVLTLVAAWKIFSIVSGIVRAVSASIAIYTAIVQGSTVATEGLTAGQAALKAVMATNPFVLIIIGLVALAAGLIYAYKHSETFRRIVDGVGRAIRTGFLAALHAIIGAFDWVKIKLGQLGDIFSHVWAQIVRVVHDAWNVIRVAIAVGLALLWVQWKTFWTVVIQPIEIAWRFITGLLQGRLHFIVTFVKVQLQALLFFWRFVWQSIADRVSIAIRVILPIIRFAIDTIKSIIQAGLKVIDVVWRVTWLAFSKFFGFIWNDVKERTRLGWKFLTDGFGGLVKVLGKVWDGLKDVIAAPINWARDHIINPFLRGVSSIAQHLGLNLHLGEIPSGGSSGGGGGGRVTLFKAGGLVPGQGRGDKVPALLEPGEAVAPRWLVPSLTPLFKAIGLPGFQAGGLVGTLTHGAGTVARTALNLLPGGELAVKAGLSLLTPALHRILDQIGGMSRFGPIGSIAGGAAKKLADGVLEWLGKNLGGGIGGSVGAPRGIPATIAGAMHQALTMLGLPQTWFGPLGVLIGRESGFNPNAINLSDVNARHGDPSRGLMQTIGATFRSFMLPGFGNIFGILDNILAGLRYILSRYGSIFRVQQANPNLPPRGYHAGGLLPPGTIHGWQPSTGQRFTFNEFGQERVVNARNAQTQPTKHNEVNLYIDKYYADGAADLDLLYARGEWAARTLGG